MPRQLMRKSATLPFVYTGYTRHLLEKKEVDIVVLCVIGKLVYYVGVEFWFGLGRSKNTSAFLARIKRL
jgi:hypothetical protein